MGKSFEIESDCLDIIGRLKAIDEGYFVKFNVENKTFELHHREQVGNTYCLTFPYNQLDERCVDFTRKTRVENSDALFEEMERENAKLEKRQTKAVLSDFEEKFYDS